MVILARKYGKHLLINLSILGGLVVKILLERQSENVVMKPSASKVSQQKEL